MFWVAAILLSLVTLASVLAAFRARDHASASPDVAVYRDQLEDVERDLARGTLSTDEAASARAEVGRRLLAADAARPDRLRRGPTALGMGLVAAIMLAAAFATYRHLGAPGYPDLPLAGRIEALEAARRARPGQELAEAEVPDRPVPEGVPAERVEAVGQLRDVLSTRPDDLRGWRLLAAEEAGLGDMEAAWRAQDRVLAILGDAAEGQEFSAMAELMILAAGGYVSPEAERALDEALLRDPANGSARYYKGVAEIQGGRPDLAWPRWRRLVADSAPDAPWLPQIMARIERVSQLAGDPTPLDALPQPGSRGPSSDDIAAAASMSPAERIEMIGGMVAGLAQRLATEGGPPADWARLITAFGVLGRLDEAAAVYAEASQVFGDDPGAMDRLRAAAERAGLAP